MLETGGEDLNYVFMQIVFFIFIIICITSEYGTYNMHTLPNLAFGRGVTMCLHATIDGSSTTTYKFDTFIVFEEEYTK